MTTSIDARWSRDAREFVSIVAARAKLRLPNWSEDGAEVVRDYLASLPANSVSIWIRDLGLVPHSLEPFCTVQDDGLLPAPATQFSVLRGAFDLSLAEAVVVEDGAWVPDLVQIGLEDGTIRREHGGGLVFSTIAAPGPVSPMAGDRLTQWLQRAAIEAVSHNRHEFFELWGARAFDLLPPDLQDQTSRWFFSHLPPALDGPDWSLPIAVATQEPDRFEASWAAEKDRLMRHERRLPGATDFARLALGAVVIGQPNWGVDALLDEIDDLPEDAPELQPALLALATCDFAAGRWNDAVAVVAKLEGAELDGLADQHLRGLVARGDEPWGRTGRVLFGAAGGAMSQAREALLTDDARTKVHQALHDAGAAALLSLAPDLDAPPDSALVEWLDDGVFRIDGQRFDISTRDSAKRILRALLESAPKPLALDQVFDAGWPDEVVAEKSKKNRVYAAIRMLRKEAGLHDILVSSGGTYGLEDVVVVWPETEAPNAESAK